MNGVTTEFITIGSQILSMKHGVATFIFRYVLNKLVGFNYNDNVTSKEYLYQRNIQGDIIGIYDDEGNQVGEYAYDGYGNQVIVKDEGGIASLNPFRYRGYYFDGETGFYYLNARYYDPETGRFISPDTLSILDETKGQINGLNLYMYCADNPIMNVDPSGHDFWDIFRIIGKIIRFIGVVVAFFCPPVGFAILFAGEGMLIINDIYQLASGNVYFDADIGQIRNSSKISTSIMIMGYSFYLKYISPSKDYFKGSAGGIMGEWVAHNIAYDVLSVLSLFTNKVDSALDSAEHVDLGHTIFEEDRYFVRFLSLIFEIVFSPLGYIKDKIERNLGLFD